MQHRSENLVLVAAHGGFHAVEEGGANVETLLIALQGKVASVHNQLGTLVHTHLNVVFDAFLVDGGHHRAIVGARIRRDAHIQLAQLTGHGLHEAVTGFIADGYYR